MQVPCKLSFSGEEKLLTLLKRELNIGLRVGSLLKRHKPRVIQCHMLCSQGRSQEFPLSGKWNQEMGYAKYNKLRNNILLKLAFQGTAVHPLILAKLINTEARLVYLGWACL